MAIINNTYGFVFVHIPKSGGTSLAHALEPLCTWRDLQLGGTKFGEGCHSLYQKKFGLSKHSFAAELNRNIGPDVWAQYTSFTVVRHPVQRTLSTYRYLWQHRDHFEFIRPFEDFNSWVQSDKWQDAGPDRILLPQTSWVNKDRFGSGRLVDVVIRLEQLDFGLKACLEKIGVPKPKVENVRIGMENKSLPHPNVEIDDTSLALIEQRYSADYDSYGYKRGELSFCP